MATRKRFGWAWVGAMAMGTFAGACSDECSFSDDDAEPFVSLECSAGQLCYLGRCLDACLAGQERTEPCEREDACGGARPFCVDGFCSACPSGFECVPALDLCRPISPAPLPEVPERPDDPSLIPPGPLDMSLPGPGLSRFPDAGPPTEQGITWAVDFTVAHRTVLTPGGTATDEPVVRVNAWDVEGLGADRVWRPEFEPPRLETFARDRDGNELRDLDCDIRVLNTPTVAVSRGSVGDVAFEDDTEDERFFLTDYDATFDGMRYRVTPRTTPPAATVFRPSLPMVSPQGEIVVSGTGASGVTQSTFSQAQHIPFLFELNSATAEQMAAGYRIDENVDRDIEFGWRDPITSGTFIGEVVFVQIDASTADDPHELICEDAEGPNSTSEIVIRRELLQAFRDRVGTETAFPIRVGRRNRQAFTIEPAPGEAIRAILDISRHFQSTIRFD
jgi:hypothetical protein